MPANYNYKCMKEINLQSSWRFSKTFLNDTFQNGVLERKKNGEFGEFGTIEL